MCLCCLVNNSRCIDMCLLSCVRAEFSSILLDMLLYILCVLSIFEKSVCCLFCVRLLVIVVICVLRGCCAWFVSAYRLCSDYVCDMSPVCCLCVYVLLLCAFPRLLLLYAFT